MANLNKLFPQTGVLFAPGTITSSTTSGNVTLPSAAAYRIICQVSTVAGTSPTMVMALLTSCDNGTTYNQIMTTTSITTTGQGAQIVFRPTMGAGDTASSFGTSLDTTNLAAATGIVDGPINPQYVKIKLVVAGTSASFTSVSVQYIADAIGLASVI